MSTTSETIRVRSMIWLAETPEGGTGALNIGKETATLHPDTVIEEEAPGEFTMKNAALTGDPVPAMFFDKDSRGRANDGTGRSFNMLGLLRRLQEVPRGQPVDLWK